jgi:hypothetical protein
MLVVLLDLLLAVEIVGFHWRSDDDHVCRLKAMLSNLASH